MPIHSAKLSRAAAFMRPATITWKNPAARANSGTPHHLSVATYNIDNEGHRPLAPIEANLRAMNADVICLNEASLATSRQLAKDLGYNLIFGKQAMANDGLAIMSRYPVKGSRNEGYRCDSPWQQLKGYFRQSLLKGHPTDTEPLGRRNRLDASICVGGKSVEILSTQLSLGDPEANANELKELAGQVEDLEAKGRAVVVAGDFNLNFGLVGHPSDASGRRRFDAVATPSQFRRRYPGAEVGNVGLGANLAAARKLESVAPDFWDHAQQREVLVEGQRLTPEMAQQELASGQVAPGSRRYRDLIQAIDGVSHLWAHKRFDNVFASPDLHVTRAFIDQSHPGSDHQPVMADLAW